MVCFTELSFIQEKPYASAEESSVEVPAGETVELYAAISGRPLPVCTWTKDGRAVKNDSYHSMKEKVRDILYNTVLVSFKNTKFF